MNIPEASKKKAEIDEILRGKVTSSEDSMKGMGQRADGEIRKRETHLPLKGIEGRKGVSKSRLVL